MKRVSVVVPTLRRPDHLKLCLASLVSQTYPIHEVLVGVRADDSISGSVIAEYAGALPVRPVEAVGVGVVGSMSSCVSTSSGDFVALVDDDVELPPDWLARCIDYFEKDSSLGGIGGRDLLQDMPEMRRRQARRRKVGIFTWYGRGHGNHHLGTGGSRYVHVLKGCNSIYVGDLLRDIGFDERLRGEGAQVGWELSLAFDVMRRGKRLLYDSELAVVHWVAPRHDSDNIHRGGFEPRALENLAYNEHLVFQTKSPLPLAWTHPLWGLAWGNPLAPGAIRACWMLCKGDKTAPLRFMINLRMLLTAKSDARRFRKEKTETATL